MCILYTIGHSRENKVPQNYMYVGQEATIRTELGTIDWSILGKEYIKAVYCHPAYLNSMRSSSCEMQGSMNHKLESRFLGEISTTSNMQMIPH